MWSRTIIALLAAALPVAGHADDRGWGEGSGNEWYVRPAGDYDVSVDLNVQGGVTFETFHGALAPYGSWVDVAHYGRVWRPSVPAGWRPYYYGRWEWTNEGWLWISDEPWGWAAYHYGRWTYDPYYGWIWVPGVEWAPAWVSWRVSGDVIGWAPLAPGYSVYVSTYPFIDFWWTFVPCVRFASVPVYTVAFAPSFSRRHFHATAPAPARPPRVVAGGRGVAAPSPAWGGPAPRLIEERIGRPVSAARIVPAPSPGAPARPGEIAVYRPEPRVAAPRALDARGRGGPPVPAPSNGQQRGGTPVAAPSHGQQRGGPPVAAPSHGQGRGPGAVQAPGSSGTRQGQRAGDDGGGWRPDGRGGGAPAAPRGGAAGVAPAPRGGAEPRGGGAPAPRGAGGRGGGGRSERGGGRP